MRCIFLSLFCPFFVVWYALSLAGIDLPCFKVAIQVSQRRQFVNCFKWFQEENCMAIISFNECASEAHGEPPSIAWLECILICPVFCRHAQILDASVSRLMIERLILKSLCCCRYEHFWQLHYCSDSLSMDSFLTRCSFFLILKLFCYVQ